MAAACYERKVGEALMLCGKPQGLVQEYTDIRSSRDSVLNVIAAAAAAAVSSSPVGCLATPIPSGSAGTTILPQPTAAYKDYSQPLHVDCSVEYELPSQAKPPPGNGEPLLMIHPCYYRRAEAERRTLFVNNLPPSSSTSGSSSSSSRRSGKSSRQQQQQHAQVQPQHAQAQVQQQQQQPIPTQLSGLMVNPVMPVAAAAPASHQQQQQPQMSLGGGGPLGMLPSPSLASIDTHNAPAAVAAAAAATYHAALTAAVALQGSHPEAKQQHPKLQQTPSELDESVLAAAGLYPQYFRGMPRQPPPQQQAPPPPPQPLRHQQQQQQQQQQATHHHQQVPAAGSLVHQAYPNQAAQQPQQPASYGMAMMAPSQRHHQGIVGSTATPTILAHHPYRRSGSRSKLSGAGTGSSSGSGGSSAVPSAASTSGSNSSYMTNMYASALQRHHHHHHHHHAIHALQAAHGGFYEAPVYHALLPQS